MSEIEVRSLMQDADRVAPAPPASVLAGGMSATPANARRNLVLRLVRSFATVASTRLRPEAIAASWRDAVEEETAFGHGLVFVPVLLAAGVLTWLSLPYDVGLVKLALLLCVFGMAALLFSIRMRALRAPMIAAGLFTAGMMLAAIETSRIDTIVLDGPVTTNLRGKVFSREKNDRDHWRYGILIEQTTKPMLRRAPLKAMVLSRSPHAPLAIGATIEGRARLSPPSGPALPGLNDFAFDSYFRQIGAVGYFYGAPRSPPADSAAAASDRSLWMRMAEYLAAKRETVGERIRTVIGGDTGALAAALVTAEERAIGRDTVEMLRQAGLAHVLAISGLNMVLAAGTFLIGARTVLSAVPGLAQRVAIKKIAAAGALTMVFLYILISGGAVSAVRAWIMISIMLVAVFFDRMSISLRNIALAAIVIIVMTPSAVAGPGFQMSFAATLALVAGYARWRERAGGGEQPTPDRWWGRRLVAGFVIGVVVTSLIGGLATAVYSAAYFQRLPAYGLLANILAAPLISIVIMPFGLFAMLLMPFGLEQYPLTVMAWGLDGMLVIARFVTSLDGEFLTGRIGPLAFLLIAFGGIMLCVLRTWLAGIGALLLFSGLACLVFEDRQLPAVLVSEDGRLVGLVTDAAIATNRDRPSDFLFSQWQRALAVENHVAPMPVQAVAADGLYPEMKPPAGKAAARTVDAVTASAVREDLTSTLNRASLDVFSCRDKAWCGARTRSGWTVVIVDDLSLFEVLCDQADLLIAPGSFNERTCPSGQARILSGRLLRLAGAVEIFAEPVSGDQRSKMRFKTSFTSLQRPWERHRAYDWRSDGFVDGSPSL
ncbi:MULTISPECIES: ComEC/Rec2 family competence protein [unclassified Ensifer]|uniref:ComEC/Rec2 family competence protein n=1 Tax=unclassified Ensifer TaxID=2633371 RepID=UPI000813CDEB|nr:MULTISPECIES: ComEC/Rec2 family competence protein [unclassified Ensifer]OCP26329.1 transporter [Ensifer sp. LC384]OCP26500.1 transporter [Ensifer sp. LC54]